MGLMIEGQWTSDDRPRFEDPERFAWAGAHMRGSLGSQQFPAQARRYHLYIAETCPWAHRTWLTRVLKGLERIVPMSRCLPLPNAEGWVFAQDEERYRDRVAGRAALHELYTQTEPRYTGRVTVPVLFDTRSRRIVNNESSEIIRMFDEVFDADGANRRKLVPPALRAEIERVNARVFAGLNRGVYQAGFARNAKDHAAAVELVFATLAWMNERLAARRYLAGDRLTEADVRAFPSLVRFDAAYYSVFGCDRAPLTAFEHVWAYTRDIYQHPGVADTVLPLERYRAAYASIPFSISFGKALPALPALDFGAAHDRATRFAAGALDMDMA